MTTISTAVGLERISRTDGYQLNTGVFDNETGNLPQRVVVFGEANTANQGGLDLNKRIVNSAAEAAQLYGYGSPIHAIMRILRPISGDGIGGIPTIVIPQESDGGATATVIVWTVTGTATANATHKITVAGRDTLDFKNYAVQIAIGDTPTVVAGKYKDAINAVLSAPVTAANVAGVLTITTKWKGLTAADLTAVISNNGSPSGVTYALTSTTAGTGVVSLSAALAQFEDDWNTIVINPYGTSQLTALETFNGKPNDLLPTGRYEGRIFKPFLAFFGSTLADKDDLIAITDAAARRDQVTNVLCPAPGSPAMPYEAAANMVRLYARVAQDNPQLDVNGLSYPDMPIPTTGNIGDLSDYNNRDTLVKLGCSTVTLKAGAYQVQDLVTTYHPETDPLFQYRYTRNLNIDFNAAYRYRILETLYVKDHVLILDDQVTGAAKAIKPKEWKAVIFQFLDDLANDALINDPAFSKARVRVIISDINPDRFETTFPYKRTGIARIESTTVNAGF